MTNLDKLIESVELFTNKVNEVKTKINNFQKEQKEFMDNHFNDLLQTFFEASPSIKLLYWTQYTPYFNDGEPCVFSIGELEFAVKTKEEKEMQVLPIENHDDTYRFKDRLQFISKNLQRMGVPNLMSEQEAKSLISLSELFYSLEDMLKYKFGDHKEITVYCNGITYIDECYHD